MAHAGKRYPLAFRRDLAQEVPSNQFGYKRVYYASAQVQNGFWASVVSTPLAYYLQETSVPEDCKWQSGPITVSGRTLRYIMTVSMTGVFIPPLKATLQIVDAVAGELAIADMLPFGHADYRELHSFLQRGANYNAALLQISGSTSHPIVMPGLDWNQYNSLP